MLLTLKKSKEGQDADVMKYGGMNTQNEYAVLSCSQVYVIMDFRIIFIGSCGAPELP